VLVIAARTPRHRALDLWRHGARVTLVYRGAQLHHHVKYWIKPDLENRIKATRSKRTSTAACRKLAWTT